MTTICSLEFHRNKIYVLKTLASLLNVSCHERLRK